MLSNSVNKNKNQIPSVTYTAMTQNRDMVNFKDYSLFLAQLSADINDLYFKSTRVTPYLTKISGPVIYPLQLSDFFILVDATNGPVTINLPSAGNKKMLIIKRQDSTANTVTVSPNGSDTIELIKGSVSILPQSSFTTISDAFTNWNVMASSSSLGPTGLAGGGLGGSFPSPIVFSNSFTTYDAFGDSITSGNGASDVFHSYSYLMSADFGTGHRFWDLPSGGGSGPEYNNYGRSGDMAGDVANVQIFPNINPQRTFNPIYTSMIGANDANLAGVGSYEAVFKNILTACYSWLGVPQDFKVFGSAGTQTGTWAADNTYQTGIGLKSTTNGSTLSLPLATYGGTIYLWYRVIDGNGGTFTYSVNGGTAVSVNCFTTPIINTANGSTKAIGCVRITGVPAGANTILITVTSATGAGNIVSIFAAGTPANLLFFQAPRIFVGGVTRRQNDNNATATAAYDADVQNVCNTLGFGGDGLQVYYINVRNYVNDTTDMADIVHPNNSGHSHLRDAFEAQIQQISSHADGYFAHSLAIAAASPTSGPIQYTALNASGLLPAAGGALAPGATVFYDTGNGNSFGIDMGAGGYGFSTRLFSPQWIALSQAPNGSAPTSNANFTDRMLLNCANGFVIVYPTTPSNSNGYFHLNGLNNASGTNLNAGITVFDDGSSASFGMDLGFNAGTGRFRTRVYANGNNDVVFSKITSGGNPTTQSNFSDMLVARGDTGNVGIGTSNPLALLHNNGSTCFTVLQLTNFAAGGSIGSAATTVDIYTSIEVAQTTAAQTLTISNPTNTGATRLLYVINTGTSSFTMLGKTINTSAGLTALWSPGKSSWIAAGNG